MVKYAELDLVFQALCDPTRRALVEQLTLGPASVSELAAPLPMSLPAVHQHLKVLERSALVRSEKVGRVRTCRLELTMLDTVQDWIDARRATWERRLGRLDTYLAALPPETPASINQEKEQV
ncbi:MAG: transcriptional regulator [Pseudonocardiales bacterium]|nr:MAG: transcriptional regulator [Pseudonocardiales bacterium]